MEFRVLPRSPSWTNGKEKMGRDEKKGGWRCGKDRGGVERSK